MRRKKTILGAILAGAFLVSTAVPAQALTVGWAGIFVPVQNECGGLVLLDDTVRVSDDVFNENGCGAEVTVQRGGSQVTATVVDRCPSCSDGDLDLSPAAFAKIADVGEGRVEVKWEWI